MKYGCDDSALRAIIECRNGAKAPLAVNPDIRNIFLLKIDCLVR